MLVGVTGFEPATFWSRTKRATKLRYTPGWSQCGDSDPRPADYESAALPTELHWRFALFYYRQPPKVCQAKSDKKAGREIPAVLFSASREKRRAGLPETPREALRRAQITMAGHWTGQDEERARRLVRAPCARQVCPRECRKGNARRKGICGRTYRAAFLAQAYRARRGEALRQRRGNRV